MYINSAAILCCLSTYYKFTQGIGIRNSAILDVFHRNTNVSTQQTAVFNRRTIASVLKMIIKLGIPKFTSDQSQINNLYSLEITQQLLSMITTVNDTFFVVLPRCVSISSLPLLMGIYSFMMNYFVLCTAPLSSSLSPSGSCWHNGAYGYAINRTRT